MMKIFLALVLSLAFAGLKADTIWPGGTSDYGNGANPVSDSRALRVGDVVTVQIIESASAQQSASTKTNKSASVAGGLGQGSFGGSSLPSNSYGAAAKEQFDGGGQSSRSGQLVTTLSARVVSVLESGNLVIEGRRSLKINEEKQNIFVRGVIRPKDVGRNNTVMSSSMSDAQITYEGRGPISEKSRAGVFTRFLDWLGIF